MLNSAPILLNCFSRGGSNILWNFFLTHPDVCSPIQETLQIFRCDTKGITLSGLRAAWLSRQLQLFNQWHLVERSIPPLKAQRYIDRILYDWKLKTLNDDEMHYKREGETYTKAEVESARLVAKNNNGLVFLTEMWLEMYHDVTFFALVRDPVALYESHKRRGITTSVEAFAAFYEKITWRMLSDAERLSTYHLVRFEDLLEDPQRMIQHLYACAGLDFGKVNKIRLKAKPHLHANGSRQTRFERGRHYWFDPGDLFQLLDPNINNHQRQQLTMNESRALQKRLAPLRDRLRYR